MKTLILGLGNPILGDDSAGLKVAEIIRRRMTLDPSIEVSEDYWGGLRLMERMIGYDQVIIVDAICTGIWPAGSVLCLNPDDVPTQHTASTHDVNLPTALQLAATLNLKMPDRIRIIAIEAENVLDFSERCSPAVTLALSHAAEAVLAELQ
ncbi:MAG TPA: hydrogenase maturation protease [Anaerolineae bacterium]